MPAHLSATKMISRAELTALVELRLSEAEALREAGLFVGAVYLAGYAVEVPTEVGDLYDATVVGIAEYVQDA